jgi:tetratricopeptide (TPR) repeat protein
MRMLFLLLTLLLVSACVKREDEPEPTPEAITPQSETPAAPVVEPEVTAPRTSRRAEGFFDQAGEQMTAGRYAEAANLMQRALELHPSEPEYNARHGHALARLNRHEEAYNAFVKAMDGAPIQRSQELRELAAAQAYRVATRAHRGNDNARAMRFTEHAIDLNPALHQAWMLKGNLLWLQDSHDEAAAAYEQASLLRSGALRDEAILRMGQARHAGGHFEAAVEAYSTAIGNGYREHDIFGWRGQALAALGRYDDATRDFHRAIEHATSSAARAEFEKDLQSLVEQEQR